MWPKPNQISESQIPSHSWLFRNRERDDWQVTRLNQIRVKPKAFFLYWHWGRDSLFTLHVLEEAFSPGWSGGYFGIWKGKLLKIEPPSKNRGKKWKEYTTLVPLFELKLQASSENLSISELPRHMRQYVSIIILDSLRFSSCVCNWKHFY